MPVYIIHLQYIGKKHTLDMSSALLFLETGFLKRVKKETAVIMQMQHPTTG